MFKRQGIRSTFLRNEEGGIAIIFGFAVIAIVGLLALSVDGGRAVAGKNKASAALDSATLAVTKALLDNNPTDAELLEIASRYFVQNVNGGSGLLVSYDNIQLSVNRATKTVRITADTHVPTTFGRIFGVDTIDFGTAAVATFNLRDIELGMQLDLTGSMCSPCSKIAALKTATKDLVDILLPDGPRLNTVRIGFAPFAAGVDAGAFADTVSNFRSSNGCVYERVGANALTDAAPAPGSFIRGNLDVPGALACPVGSPVLPLTDDKDLLKLTVDTYNTNGWTAGHLGTSWAWYLVSPNWSGVWPAASQPVDYGTPDVVKATLLMTDGDYNTYGGRNGREALSQQTARDVCDNIKAEGIIVYAVGFQLPNQAARDVMDYCASPDGSGGKFFYDAANADELNAAFQDIAFKLSNLRLAQ